MEKIKLYTPSPIFTKYDYLTQATELKKKILTDKNLISSNPKNDDEKWDWRNMYHNIYLYWYLNFQYLFSVLETSMSDNSSNEAEGWFIFPRNERILLGNADNYHTVDSYNTVIYTKYFDRFFNFTIKDSIIDEYFGECKTLFKNELYYSCACSIFPIIEYYTRKLSKYTSEKGHFKQHNALNEIVNTIPQWSGVPKISFEIFQNEYRKISEFMSENYYKTSKQEDAEPKFICRNRLLHGIITRNVSAADCLKLFLIMRSFVYLDKAVEIEDKLFRLNCIVLNIEDRIIFGDEEYEKMINQIIGED